LLLNPLGLIKECRSQLFMLVKSTIHVEIQQWRWI
uniref:Ovule protein n=1 Tax=Anisakis simplex TaxID=6269 RepID=A0A0M3JCS7_ANISI